MERGIFVKYHFLFRFFGFTVSAALILGGAFQLINNTVDVILISTGTSLLAGTIASLFDTIFLSNPSPHDARKLGLVACYRSDDSHFTDRIKDARSLDIIFNTGRQVFNVYEPAIDEALQNPRCTFRILTSNPESPIFQDPDLLRGLTTPRPPGEPPPDLRFEVENIIGKVRGKFGAINNSCAPCIITGSLIIIDGKFVRYSPYLPYISSRTAPVFDIIKVGGEQDLFTVYQKRFNEIWKEAGEKRRIIPPPPHQKTSP